MTTARRQATTAQGTTGTMLHFRCRVIPIPKIMLCFNLLMFGKTSKPNVTNLRAEKTQVKQKKVEDVNNRPIQI